MQHQFIVKICGVKTVDQAMMVLKLRPTMIGLNFVTHSPRCVDRETAEVIAKAAKVQGVSVVGVFQDESLETVSEIISEIGLDYVQLHGVETVDYVHNVGAPVIKTLKLRNHNENLQLLSTYADYVRYFLIDRPKQGHGVMADLGQVKRIASEFPVIMAGGLTRDNVTAVIAALGQNLAGVDVASGVEQRPAEKDQVLVREFIDNAKKAYSLL